MPPNDEDREHNPWMRKRAATANLSNSHKRSRKQEDSLAKRLKAQVTPASGARDDASRPLRQGPRAQRTERAHCNR